MAILKEEQLKVKGWDKKDLVKKKILQNKFGSNNVLSPKLFGGHKFFGPKTVCPDMFGHELTCPVMIHPVFTCA